MDLSVIDDLKERLSLGAMGKPALVGIVALLAVVACFVLSCLFGATAADEFQLDSSSTSSGALDVSADAQPVSATLYVHVSGEVRNPGLCEVDGGARVAAAIEAAGGFTDDAATDSVNLAREVSDGEQIMVARKLSEEEVAAARQDSVTTASSAGGSAGASGLVNINTASEADLKSLPGICDSTAAKIVADRQANGAFKTIDDLKRVSGIGDKKLESISGLICI